MRRDEIDERTGRPVRDESLPFELLGTLAGVMTVPLGRTRSRHQEEDYSHLEEGTSLYYYVALIGAGALALYALARYFFG